MIEIILRDDVSNYETKPLFGFSYRQAAAMASACLIAVGCWFGLTPLGVPTDLVGLLILLLGASVAAGFLVKVHGMYGTKRLPILFKYYMRPKTVFTQNCIFRTRKKPQELTKKELREEKRERARARRETEFCDADGVCVNAKKRCRLVHSGEIKSNKRKITFEDVERAFNKKVEKAEKLRSENG